MAIVVDMRCHRRRHWRPRGCARAPPARDRVAKGQEETWYLYFCVRKRPSGRILWKAAL